MHISPSGFEISHDPARVDFGFVRHFLSEESPWARGIPTEALRRAIDNSLCFSIFEPGEKQVGFARVVSDLATFAYVDDLFVDENYRGRGLGGALVNAVLTHPDLCSVKSWWLFASGPEARRLFERHGFRQPERERLARWMTTPGGTRGYWKWHGRDLGSSR